MSVTLDAPAAIGTADDSPEARLERARALYESLWPVIETPENIGKIVAMELNSGDYEVDDDPTGIPANERLRSRHAQGEFWGWRIGYNAADAFGGTLERIPRP